MALALSTVALQAQANAGSTVKVINQSSHTVLTIVSSPTYRSGHGKTDLLGNGTVLRPGYQVNVDFESDDAENECVQDILVRGMNGVKWTKTMNVCNVPSWTLTD